MNQIEQNKNVIRELCKILPEAEPWERATIEAIIRRRQLHLDLLNLLANLERQPYDPKTSRMVDAINVLLECY